MKELKELSKKIIRPEFREALRKKTKELGDNPTKQEIGFLKNVVRGYIKDQDTLKKAEQEKRKTFSQAMSAFADYINMAEEFIKTQPIYYDENKIWWLWDSKEYKWAMIDETDLLNRIRTTYEDSNITVINSKKRGEIIEALKQVGREHKPKEVPKTWVQFKSKIIDVATNEEMQATPEYHIMNPIPWELGESEDTPVMDKLLKEWVGEKWVVTLQQLIAFCLLPNYFLHRIFCLNGVGLNGKGSFMNLLTNLVGNYNICSTELDMLLRSRFESAKLYKKLVCMMGETDFKIIKRTNMIKRLTGQDPTGVEIKNKNPFDVYNYAKIIIATNQLPTTFDKSVGYYRRWLIIDFPNQFDEKNDVLSKIPEQEYNNLARKSLRILKELMQDREFANEGTIEERAQRYEERSNPLSKFMKERCERAPGKYILFGEFYDEFVVYLKDNGYTFLTLISVSKQLREDGYDILKKNITRGKLKTSAKAICEITWKTSLTNSTHSINSTQVSLSSLHGESECNVGTKDTIDTPLNKSYKEKDSQSDIDTLKFDVKEGKRGVLLWVEQNQDIKVEEVLEKFPEEFHEKIKEIITKLLHDGVLIHGQDGGLRMKKSTGE